MASLPLQPQLTYVNDGGNNKKFASWKLKAKRSPGIYLRVSIIVLLKGRGMLFKEVREYQAGDDIRFIDWNVSARFNHPFSKVFEEERELSVMLMVDVSASSLFGTTQARKKDLITEVAAVLAFSAISNNDKIGVLFFSDVIEKYIPPKKGRDHGLYIVRELLTAEPKKRARRIGQALQRLNNTIRQTSIVFTKRFFLITILKMD